jgi:hypothetical protein
MWKGKKVQGSKLKAQGSRLKAQGSRLKAKNLPQRSRRAQRKELG